MRSITLTEQAWAALERNARGWGIEPINPQRSPYGHVYLFLDPMTQTALEAARGPSGVPE